MIRFKCVYCGRKLIAKDEQRNKKGKCPECSHIVMVPTSTKGKRILDPDISERSQKMNEACAIFEIAHQKDYEDEDVPLCFEKPAWFVPTYDQLSLFLMSITFIILAIINTTLQKDIFKIIMISFGFGEASVYIIFLLLMCLAGMCLSLYHMFANKEAGDTEKKLMVTFAAVINAVTSILASYYIIRSEKTSGILLIFPILNLINAALIILMLYLKIINRNCIIKRNVSFFRAGFSLILSIIILLLCEYIFKIYWAITFSICMAYVTSFDRAISNTLSDKFVTKE